MSSSRLLYHPSPSSSSSSSVATDGTLHSFDVARAMEDGDISPPEDGDESDSSGSMPRSDGCPIPAEAVAQPFHFRTATDEWAEYAGRFGRTSPNVHVFDESGQQLLEIPSALLARAKVLTLEAIVRLIRFCFEEEGSLFWSDGQEATGEEALTTARSTLFVYKRLDGSDSPCQPRDGPHFRAPYGLCMSQMEDTLVQAEQDEDNLTAAACKIQEDVRHRFNSSIITGSSSSEEYLVPTPIVPPPVGERFKAIMRQEWTHSEWYTKSSDFPQDLLKRSLEDIESSWILLDEFQQRKWYCGQLALWPYPIDDCFIVHDFGNPVEGSPHGNCIPSKRFNCKDPELFQDLLKFHYSQCAMKMLRGFSAGRPPCSEMGMRWTFHHGEDYLITEDSYPWQPRQPAQRQMYRREWAGRWFPNAFVRSSPPSQQEEPNTHPSPVLDEAFFDQMLSLQ